MFAQLISHHARIRPDAVAIVAPGRMLSFARFDAEITLMQALLAQGAELEGLVAVSLSDIVEHWTALFALARMGLATISVLGMQGAELDEHLSAAGARWIVADDMLRLASARTVRLGADWRQRAAAAAPTRSVQHPTALARVSVTSGSTGARKLIGLSFELLDRRIKNAPLLGPLGGGKLLSLIGVDNWGGFFGPLISWATSGGVVFVTGKVEWAALLTNTTPELLIASPLHLAAMLRGLPPTFQALGGLRIVVAGGAMPPVLSDQIRARLSPALHISYASTEAGFSSYGHIASFPGVSGAAGFVLPWSEVEVVDEAGAPVAAGEIGLIRARGEEAVSGYHGSDPDDSDFRDGWFYPGDQGSVSAEGLLVIAGRTGELMNCGGVKLSPYPFEDALLRAPGVVDVAVVALPGPDGIETPHAAVVAGPGFGLQAAQEALKPLKHDVAIVLVDDIPRTPGLAKIVREAVREKVRSTLASNA